MPRLTALAVKNSTKNALTKNHKTGTFKPKYPLKYIGKVKKIVYKSSLEYMAMRHLCDENPACIYWSSEEIEIPYYDKLTKRWRTYYPDLFMKVDAGNNKAKRVILEVKASKMLEPPKKMKEGKTIKGRQQNLFQAKSYITNRCKIDAAKSYCAKNNIVFKIITEKTLKQFDNG